MGKGLIIIILGSVMTLSMMNMKLVRSVKSGTEDAVSYFEKTQSRNESNSMVNMILSRIADNPSYRTKGYQTKILPTDTVTYRVVDTVLAVEGAVIKIETIVKFDGYPKKTTTFLDVNNIEGWVPKAVRGGWTANADLNNTISDMVIDGRDHDLNLNVIPNRGIMGISSSVEFNNNEGAEIGGTHMGTNYAPQYPENQDIIEESYNWGGQFPETPDEILGYPEGTLKAIAKSGIGGSQYLLNPKNDDIDERELEFPLRGVTYIEITDGNDRQLRFQGPGNSGIVIAHGPGATSRLTGVKMEELELGRNETIVCHMWNTPNERTMIINKDALADHLAHGDIQETCGGNYTHFQGLIITDYSFHHHLDILGAIMQLSPNLEMSKDCNGNADHWVKYSSEAIKTATKFTAEISGLQGNNPNVFSSKGFGMGRHKVSLWYE